MDLLLQGKVALVTGSTSGIGLGIATGLAHAGMHVVLNGIEKDSDGQAIAAKLQSNVLAQSQREVKVVYQQADMSKPETIADLVAKINTEFGGLDVLVNNAGIQYVKPIEEFPNEKWDAILALNLSSSFHTAKQAVPLMKASGWGRIINIASAHGLVASPYKSAYVAAKHGLIGLTKTLGLELAEHNITCNAVCPGYVLTPLVQNQIKDTAKARNMTEDEVVKNVLLSAQWTKKFVSIEQVADTVLFLCSAAAENITGTSLSVDGGWTAA